ncbi:FxsA family protein [Marinobacter sp. C2H3]|uniref:FxsA family protein n=1 Tax=Marinobacter sp. C2H3 TaxID=3119003 RepID=UPI00300E7CB3
MPIFFGLFILLPIAEMAVLIKVGGIIGVFNTIGLVLLTAMIGGWLLRQQGLATLTRARARLNSGELPAQEVAEGLVLAAGGALLLTPGFITDTFGLLCLLPGSRQWLVRQAMKRLVISGQGASMQFGSGAGPFAGGQGPFGPRGPFDQRGDVIDGEYQDHTERDHDRLQKK